MIDQITNSCVGCRTCEYVCPKKAISFHRDEEGFIVPVINAELCVDCLLCKKKCPQNHKVYRTIPLGVYALRYKDDSWLLNSASGGAFIGIAISFINNGGIVFGATYDENLRVYIKGVDSLKGLRCLQSSKYVQADVRNSYGEVKQALQYGKHVLFSGTPCQVAGLKSFLKVDYSNLYTIDVICHGTPSPLLFEKYIQFLGKINKSDIISYNFRDKKRGWGLRYRYRYITKNGNYCNNAELDPYYYHFLKGDTYREACYKCQYANTERVGDFTIGDYWGIKEGHPDFFSKKGVSLLFVNTVKGEDWFSQNSDIFYCKKSTLEKAIKKQDNLKEPTYRPYIRDVIYDGINEMGCVDFFEKNMKVPFSWKGLIKKYLPSNILSFYYRFKSFIC